MAAIFRAMGDIRAYEVDMTLGIRAVLPFEPTGYALYDAQSDNGQPYPTSQAFLDQFHDVTSPFLRPPLQTPAVNGQPPRGV